MEALDRREKWSECVRGDVVLSHVVVSFWLLIQGGDSGGEGGGGVAVMLFVCYSVAMRF